MSLAARYEPDPFYITKDSLMNFEKDCTVIHYGKIGRVEQIDKKMISVVFQDKEMKYIRYTELHVVGYKKEEPQIRLSKFDKIYIFSHVDEPSEKIARELDKPVQQIEKFKLSLK